MNRVKEFEAWLHSQGKDGKTVKAYRGDVVQYAEWYQEKYQKAFSLGALAQTDMISYRRYLREVRKLRPATVNRKLNGLRMLAHFAVDQRAIHETVAEEMHDQVKPVPVQEAPPKWMAKHEFNRLKAEYERAMNAELVGGRSARYEQAVLQFTLMMLMRATGLRINEALGLNLEDVVLRERSGHVVVWFGKGGTFAEQPIHSYGRDALRKWVNIRGEYPGPLFLSQKGNRLSDRQVQRYYKEMCRRAGVSEDFTPHSLRHTYIRMLITAGIPIGDAQKLARHKRVEQTLEYAKAGEQDLLEAVEAGWE